MIDYDDIRLTATYSVKGRPGVLTIEGTDHDVTAIDVTAARAVEPLAGRAALDVGSGIGILGIVPAASVRASELVAKDIGPDDLDDALLAFNGKNWRVEAHQPMPGAAGEASGEVYLMLSEIA